MSIEVHLFFVEKGGFFESRLYLPSLDVTSSPLGPTHEYLGGGDPTARHWKTALSCSIPT